MEIRRFLAELKGRGVYRVAAIYAAGSWALLQVADVFFPMFGLPDWAVSMVLLAAAMGFPLALILAWAFDLTPEGIVETDPVLTTVDGRLRLSPARLIELALLIALVGLVGYLYLDRLSTRETLESPDISAPAHSRASIAVLPFVNMSESSEVEYFGDGLAEEILNLLAKIPELDVAARTSSFYFKGRDADIQQIAKHLSVGHVLEGSVRRQENTVRVTAQLIRADNGYHLWSETYDRDFSRTFQIQDEIARSVVDKLQIILSSDSSEILSRAADLDPQAYDYYLQGRDYLRRARGAENYVQALALFEKAIALDSDYLEALASRCQAYIGLYSQTLDAKDYELGVSSCAQALELDQTDPQLYVAQGDLHVASGEYGPAIQQYQQALSHSPRLAQAYIGLGNAYRRDNKIELSQQMFQKAIEVQPSNWHAYRGMGGLLFQAGRNQEAVSYFRRITELLPDDATALSDLGGALYLSGDFAAATEIWRQSLELNPNAFAYSNLGTSLYFEGRFEEAAEMYQQAVKHAPENFEWWGNLGDAYRFSEELGELAQPMYANALKLAQQRLEVNPADADTLAMVAYYSANLGDREEALTYLARANALAQQNMYIYYGSATTFATLGEPERALDALVQAVELGYSTDLVEVDPVLDELKPLPGFQQLLEH